MDNEKLHIKYEFFHDLSTFELITIMGLLANFVKIIFQQSKGQYAEMWYVKFQTFIGQLL